MTKTQLAPGGAAPGGAERSSGRGSSGVLSRLRSRLAGGPGLVALAAAVLLAVAFGGSLGGDFVWDDVPLVQQNRALIEPGGLWVLLTRDLWGSAGQGSRQL